MNNRTKDHAPPRGGDAARDSTALPDFLPVNELAVCNLVMKGGVTSGVVFPGTIRVLASTYRFRRIGGTSAGAIAAAFAAAGEFARRETKQATAFQGIYALGDELSQPPSRGRHRTNLEALFAPNVLTEQTYRLVTALAHVENDRKSSNTPVTAERRTQRRRTFSTAGRTAVALMSVHPLPVTASAVGMLGALGGGVGLLTGQPGAAGIALAGTWGALAGFAWLGKVTVVDGLRRVTANGYGLSKGYEILDADDSAPQGDGTQTLRFTSWLHAKLQRLTGLDRQPGPPGGGVTPVLTFGHLAPAAYRLPEQQDWSQLYALESAPDDLIPAELGELDFDAHAAYQRRTESDIELRQITTNLTFGRPVTLPVDDTSTDARTLYFRLDQWQQYFPSEIMSHLVRHAERVVQPDGESFVYYRLPPPAMLPVVVSTRLSMSFPGLFTPVPLFYGMWRDEDRIRPGDPQAAWPKGRSRKRNRSYRSFHLADWATEQPGRHRLEPLVFGDGGLTSNFPLALFDDLSPSEPTFGLDLYAPPGDDQRPAFLIPPSLLRKYGKRDAEQRARWNPSRNGTGSLFGYAMSILESARNWSDNAMMGLPGFGERVVHIVIASGLGGTNLSMTAPQIRELRDRGVAAGQKLIQRFHTGEDVQIHRDLSVPWNWEIHRANQFLRLTADLERALQDYALAYSDVNSQGEVQLKVPAIPADQVMVQHGQLFDNSANAPWQGRAAALIALGRQTTTLHGYRKLRGRRGLLRYRALH